MLDANLWIAAFDPRDRFHEESVAVFATMARKGLLIAGPAYVVLESACALGRRLGDPGAAKQLSRRIDSHPALHLEPVSSELLAEAERLGLERSLRGADALYAATAIRLRCPLLSWDDELITRFGALSPREWNASQSSDLK